MCSVGDPSQLDSAGNDKWAKVGHGWAHWEAHRHTDTLASSVNGVKQQVASSRTLPDVVGSTGWLGSTAKSIDHLSASQLRRRPGWDSGQAKVIKINCPARPSVSCTKRVANPGLRAKSLL
eukprot:9667380-Alexandrium_andersonii.AAC.2